MRIPLCRNFPRTRSPTLALCCAAFHRGFTGSRGRQVAFHVAGTYTPNLENVRVIWVLHVMDVADGLRLAHLAIDLRLSKILNIYASPAAMRHSGYRPLASPMRDQLLFCQRISYCHRP